MSIPIYSNWNPAKHLIGAVLTAPIYFEVSDVNDGIDTTTLNIKLNSIDACIGGIFQAGYFGTITLQDPFPKKIAVYIGRVGNWNYSEHVTIAVKIEDKIGTIGNDNWDFITIPNPDHTSPIVAANPHGGVFNATQLVTLSSTEPVTIYYTTNGTVPNLTSPIYSAPIPITNEGLTTLKFYGLDTNNNYDVLQGTWTATLQNIELSHGDGLVGLQVNNTNVGKRINLILNDVDIESETATDHAIDVNRGGAAGDAIRLYANGHGNTIEGLVDYISENTDDRVRFWGYRLVGGITVTGAIVNEIVFVNCGIKTSGESFDGANVSSHFGCYYETDGNPNDHTACSDDADTT